MDNQSAKLKVLLALVVGAFVLATFLAPANGQSMSELRRQASSMPTIDNELWASECSDCHMAYQPEWLPKAAWVEMLNNLEDHFGDDASLSSAEVRELVAFAEARNAETSEANFAKQIVRWMRPGDHTLRISEVRYIVRKHDELDPAVLTFLELENIAFCDACHTEAVEGVYDERGLKRLGIPYELDD